MKSFTSTTLTIAGPKKYGKGWQGTLAKKLGVHRTTVMRWASGRAPMKSLVQTTLKNHFRGQL